MFFVVMAMCSRDSACPGYVAKNKLLLILLPHCRGSCFMWLTAVIAFNCLRRGAPRAQQHSMPFVPPGLQPKLGKNWLATNVHAGPPRFGSYRMQQYGV